MDRIIKAKGLLLLVWDSDEERQETGVSSEQEAGDEEQSDEAAVRMLADLIDRSGLPRQAAALAEVVQRVLMCDGLSGCGKEIDDAEAEFMRAAEAVSRAWRDHDEGPGEGS